jgi:hypothetical protein
VPSVDTRAAELQRRQALAAANRIREVEALAAKHGRSAEIADDLRRIRESVEALARDIERRA